MPTALLELSRGCAPALSNEIIGAKASLAEREIEIDRNSQNAITVPNSDSNKSVRKIIMVVDERQRRVLGRPWLTLAIDVASRVVRTVDALGKLTTTLYDAANRTIASIDPLANRTTTIYDAASQVLSRIDALGNRASTVYDAAGRSIAD